MKPLTSSVKSATATATAILLFVHIAMAGITVLLGAEPKTYSGPAPVLSQEEFFRQSAEREFVNFTGDMILSSHDRVSFTPLPMWYASSDSFVRGAIQAWGEHLHLVLRPEEVWFTILTQMNFYMNAHAEELRDVFVPHDGQEVVYIEDRTWEAVLIRFQEEIQKRVKTPWLKDWIVPNFTTTLPEDQMTANVLMMGLTKAYFKFEGGIICGLPSVTLLGEAADWEALLAKLDRLGEFGEEPAAYAARLRPILSRFVRTFTAPDDDETRRFWNNIATATETHICGAAPFYLSGWITGFHYWTDRGRAFARNNNTGYPGGVTLDGVTYASVDPRQLPAGYAKVPLTMRDYPSMGDRLEATLLAGTLGKIIVHGTPAGDEYTDALIRAGLREGGNGEDRWKSFFSLQPGSGWVLFGPVERNATVAYVEEEELTGLLDGVGRWFDEAQCAAH